jgi:hypothetical protein
MTKGAKGFMVVLGITLAAVMVRVFLGMVSWVDLLSGIGIGMIANDALQGSNSEGGAGMKLKGKLWTRVRNRWEGWRDSVAFRKVLPELYEYTVKLLRSEKERADRLAVIVEKDGAELTGSGLDIAEVERLALLAERCGATAQAISWALRRGYNAMPPYGALPIRVMLERELGNLRCAINLMHDAGDVRGKEMITWQQKYRAILTTTTRYQAPRDEQ